MTVIDAMRDRYNNLDHTSRRIFAVITCIILILVTAYFLVLDFLNNLETKKVSREQVLSEMLVLQQRYREAAADGQRLSNRMATVTAEDNPAALIEQSGIAAKGGIQSKPLPRQEKNGVQEESAEVTVSGLNVNELVNLLHRLEQHPKPLAIRRITAKTRFNDPTKLDTAITLTLFRPAPAGNRK